MTSHVKKTVMAEMKLTVVPSSDDLVVTTGREDPSKYTRYSNVRFHVDGVRNSVISGPEAKLVQDWFHSTPHLYTSTNKLMLGSSPFTYHGKVC